MNTKKLINKWEADIRDVLLGHTIEKIAYMSKSDTLDMGWSYSPLIITLDDGTEFFPSKDDEGNEGGSYLSSHGDIAIPLPIHFSAGNEQTFLEEAKILEGNKIISVKYTNDKDLDNLGWYKKSLIISLSDGSYIVPTTDTECNDGGSIFTNISSLSTIPTIS